MAVDIFYAPWSRLGLNRASVNRIVFWPDIRAMLNTEFYFLPDVHIRIGLFLYGFTGSTSTGCQALVFWPDIRAMSDTELYILPDVHI